MISREDELRREIAELDAVIAEVNAIAGDLSKDEINPSQEKAREEVRELLGVNYVGAEIFNELFSSKNSAGLVEKAVELYRKYVLSDDLPMIGFQPRSGVMTPLMEPNLDFVKLKEILDEPDEWNPGNRKYETYALVYTPAVSLLELNKAANRYAERRGATPAFSDDVIKYAKDRPYLRSIPDGPYWELVRIDTIPDSESKSFENQSSLITPFPSIRVTSFPALCAMMVGQYLSHGTSIYGGELHFGRSVSLSAPFGVVDLGDLRELGASINDFNAHNMKIGLSVSRSLTECLGGSA